MTEPTVTVTFTAAPDATGKVEFRREPTAYSPWEHPDNSATNSPAPPLTWSPLASAEVEDGEASVALPANAVLQARFTLGGDNPQLPGFPAVPIPSTTWTSFRVPNTGPRDLRDLIAAYNVHPTPSHLADIVPTSTLFNPAA